MFQDRPKQHRPLQIRKWCCCHPVLSVRSTPHGCWVRCKGLPVGCVRALLPCPRFLLGPHSVCASVTPNRFQLGQLAAMLLLIKLEYTPAHTASYRHCTPWKMQVKAMWAASETTLKMRLPEGSCCRILASHFLQTTCKGSSQANCNQSNLCFDQRSPRAPAVLPKQENSS